MPFFDQLSKRPWAGWSQVPQMFGDSFTCSDGTVIRRHDDFEVSPHLPSILHPTRLVQGDLIPHTSWGASLSNLLTKSSWDALRLPLIAQRAYACQLCGVSGLPSFDVHEVWSYQMPPSEEMAQVSQSQSVLVFGVQTLEALMVLCQKCHACFHLGYAQSQGRLPSVLKRLAGLNRWSDQQIGLYKKLVFGRYHIHSQVHWILDFQYLNHPHGGLTLKSGWEEVPGLPLITGKSGQYTSISNTPWKFAREKEWRLLVP